MVMLVVIVILGAVVGIFAVTHLRSASSSTTTYTCLASNPPNASCSAVTSVQGFGGPPPLAELLYAQNVSCSLQTGACTMTVVNNSTTPVTLETCRMGVGVNPTSIVNGTIGGPGATSDVPAHGQIAASCTVPLPQLEQQQAVQQSKGSSAGGTFTAKLVDSYYGSPAGTGTYFDFEGTWS